MIERRTTDDPGAPTPGGRVLRPRADGGEPAWLRWLPGLRLLLRYERGWLRHDGLAGLVLTSMLGPGGGRAPSGGAVVSAAPVRGGPRRPRPPAPPVFPRRPPPPPPPPPPPFSRRAP